MQVESKPGTKAKGTEIIGSTWSRPPPRLENPCGECAPMLVTCVAMVGKEICCKHCDRTDASCEDAAPLGFSRIP